MRICITISNTIRIKEFSQVFSQNYIYHLVDFLKGMNTYATWQDLIVSSEL